MAGLDGQDGPGRGQVGCTHDVGRGAQVRAHTHALEDGGRLDEARDVGDAEVVRAGGHWGCARFGESGGQEGNVGGLVRGDFLQVGVESRVEAACCELGLSEVLQTCSVEGVFEMLQGESIVENVGVGDRWGGLADFPQKGSAVFGALESVSSREYYAFGRLTLG